MSLFELKIMFMFTIFNSKKKWWKTSETGYRKKIIFTVTCHVKEKPIYLGLVILVLIVSTSFILINKIYKRKSSF